jgi:hypothetical protein
LEPPQKKRARSISEEEGTGCNALNGWGKEKAKIDIDMAKKRRNTRSLSEVGYVFLSLQLGSGGFQPASPRFATPAFPR